MRKKVVKSIVIVSMILFCGCYSSITIKNFNPGIDISDAFPDFDSLEIMETIETYGSLVPDGLYIHGGYLFAGDFSGRVYAFDLDEFEEVGYAGSRNTTISCAPLFSGDKMYYLYRKKLIPDLHLVKYNLRTGKEELDKTVGVSGEATLHQFENEIIVICGKEVSFYDSMFTQIKKIEISEEISSITSQIEGIIYLGSYSGSLFGIDLKNKKITALKPKFNELVSTISKIGDNFVVSLEGGKIFYVGEEGFNFWEYEIGRITASPLVVGGSLFVGTLSGIVHKISIKTGKITAKYDTGGLINLPLTVSGKNIIVPVADGRLFVLSSSNLDHLQTIGFEGRIRTKVVIKGGLMFLGYDNGNISVLKPFR